MEISEVEESARAGHVSAAYDYVLTNSEAHPENPLNSTYLQLHPRRPLNRLDEE